MDSGIRRFGLFVGANNGGGGRITLRYAVSDARSIAGIFSVMGGIQDEDHILLVEPSSGDIDRNLAILQNKILDAKRNFKRTELVFYYSGHSDEDGLLLGRQKYSYRELRNRINSLSVDMRIVILDSCASGAFTRLKGGVKTASFLLDDSVSVEGYAFLTSSSAAESSQESDLIAGSYFTHSLLSGLRGAADMAGDGRVTLNELYNFAYRETLAKTETSLYGVQHPSYDMQISGTGEVVLTDVKETSAGLIFEADITGRLVIRDSSDFLVAELTKAQNKALEIGLEPGSYRVILQQGDSFFRAEAHLSREQRGSLSLKNFSPIAPSAAVSRGGPDDPAAEPSANASADASALVEGESSPDAAYPVEPLKIHFIPNIWLGSRGEPTVNYFLLGILGVDGWTLRGFGAAPIGISNYHGVTGVQLGGIYATAAQDVRGLQAAGIFSYAGGEVTGWQSSGILGIGKGFTGGQFSGIGNINLGNLNGVQAAGIFNFTPGGTNGVQLSAIANWTGGPFNGLQMGLVNIADEGGFGVQVGLVNISGDARSVPIGLVNIAKGGILNPSIWLDSMGFMNLGFKSGSKYFYSHLSAGVREIPLGDSRLAVVGQDGDEENMVSRIGLGGEIPLGRLFLGIEALCGIISKTSVFGEYKDENESTLLVQGRLIGGFKFFSHLAVFAGLSYDYLRPFSSQSPVPGGGLNLGGDDDNIHRLGFFGGIQF
ncbi:MAG: caspase family protein [Treponema sp.]|nr:caspase family protein [Treponema sp.]